MRDIGRLMVMVGLGVTAVGALVWWVGVAFPGFRPGRLPGDAVVERPGVSVYVPIVTMVLLSLLLTGVLWLVAWLRR